MPLVNDLSTAQLCFQVGAGSIDQFEVLRYRGTEGLCQLYRFEIELACDDEEVAFDDVVGESAVLTINTDHGERWFHGLVGRFERTGETTGLTYFRAELVPTLWLLTHRYSSRIFQNQTVPEILQDVLTRGGIPTDRIKVEGLGRTYQPREYCVQYRETDYNFVCRLMEEEGIRWYFEQSKDAHTLVLADGEAATYTAIEGAAEGGDAGDGDGEADGKLEYRPATGLQSTQEHVSRFRLGQAVRPGAVVLNDFHFENPALNLNSVSDCERNAQLEFYDYPGRYVEQSHGGELAKLRAQEFEAGRTVGIGQSTSPRLTPGRTFELTGHPGGLDDKYLVTSVTYQGKQATTRASTGANGRAAILDARTHQSLLSARSNENSEIRELAEALLQVVAKLTAGDPTAHRALTQWLYHAGQVSRDMGSIAGASGGNPLEALTIPNLLEDVAAGSIDNDAPIYDCRFECIPATITYRPPRVTPWPQMRGSQTARVVGPSGEEIHTDQYGRVKVQFNWDREGQYDDNSSCWIRVSQGFAGGNYGMMFLPRIGQEVVVDFLEGNPDQPLITGRVYNSDHMPPYKLPDEKTKSVIKTRSSTGGGGSNEIRFEDLKDQEQILVYGQKDVHVRAQNDLVETVENDRHLTVSNDQFQQIKKNYHLKVEEENHSTEVGGDKSLKVGGKVSEKVTGTYSTDAGGDVVFKFGGGHKHDVSMTYALKALGVKIEASTGIELKCGGSSLVLTPAAIFVTGGPMVNINTGSGPPVTPPTAAASAPAAPEAPGVADEVEHGTDSTYSGGEELAVAELEPPIAGQDFEPEEVEVTEPSWISLELVDEADQPVAGERYEIIAPDGEVIRSGSLDATGQAYVSLPEAGEYKISFPNLDMEAWERI